MELSVLNALIPTMDLYQCINKSVCLSHGDRAADEGHDVRRKFHV